MEYIELQYKSLVCSHLYQKILKHIPPIFTDNEKQSLIDNKFSYDGLLLLLGSSEYLISVVMKILE